MHTISTSPHVTVGQRDSLRRSLLLCGIVGAALYPLADILASVQYPNFSYRHQAVSELFAIGAPTSTLVVTLFTISSGLLLLFAIGIWLSADHRRLMKPITAMMALNAIDALLLWNFFPMHMRGVEPTFTDTMHGLLAVDPFLLATIVLAALAFRGPFRVYTIISLSSRRYAPSARSGTCRCSSPTSPRHGWVRWNAPDNTPQTCGTQCWR